MNQKRASIALAILIACLTPITLAEPMGAPRFVVTDVSMLDQAYIVNGQLVTNLNHPTAHGVIARYTGADLLAPVQSIQCRARFVGGGAVALVCGPVEDWSVAGLTARSIHVVFSNEGYYLGFYENGLLTDVLTGEYTLDLTGDTAYTFGLTISGTTLTLELPTGKKVKKKDPRVETCDGSRVIFEHFITAEDAAQGHFPTIEYIYAKGKDSPALEDNFDRGDGLPVAAPSGHIYVQFRNADAQ